MTAFNTRASRAGSPWRGVAIVLGFIAALLATAPAALADGTTVELVTRTGRHPITVEWAVTPAERSKGLMFRTSMPEDAGMLFDFGSDQDVAFWMHNTPLSLDMVFIASDGIVKRIAARATPYSDTEIPSGSPVRYVLEINGGRAAALGLAPGDRVVIPAH